MLGECGTSEAVCLQTGQAAEHLETFALVEKVSRESYLSSPEGGVRFAAQLVEAVVDSCLEHAILQEGEKGSWCADLAPGVVESDLHIGMLLLLVHKGTQPGCGVRGQPVPATTAA